MISTLASAAAVLLFARPGRRFEERREPALPPVIDLVAESENTGDSASGEAEISADELAILTYAGLCRQKYGDWLEHHEPDEHADRLLAWLTDDGNLDSARFGAGYELTFPELQAAYREMCAEIGWHPIAWELVGTRFAGISGGKKYRPALDPKTGRKTRRERVYRIPSVVELTAKRAA